MLRPQVHQGLSRAPTNLRCRAPAQPRHRLQAHIETTSSGTPLQIHYGIKSPPPTPPPPPSADLPISHHAEAPITLPCTVMHLSVAVGSTWDGGTAFLRFGTMRESKVIARPHHTCCFTPSSLLSTPHLDSTRIWYPDLFRHRAKLPA